VLWTTDVGIPEKIGSKYAITLCVCIKTCTLRAGPIWATVIYGNRDLWLRASQTCQMSELLLTSCRLHVPCYLRGVGRVFLMNRLAVRRAGYTVRPTGCLSIQQDIQCDRQAVSLYSRIYSATDRLSLYAAGYTVRPTGCLSVQQDIQCDRQAVSLCSSNNIEIYKIKHIWFK
jgi:hypothetical protein